MSHEHTDFARWRFSQRTGQTAARRAYAGEHYTPEHGSGFLATLGSYALAAFIGAALALCIVYSI